jgi:predicted transcriptional regulator
VDESSPTDIMWNTGHSYSQINRLLGKLSDYGIVERRGSKRGIKYSLTKDGMELAGRIEEIVKITKNHSWNILPKGKVSKQPSV